jgi:cbb3-type cytochrome oxidase subunit 3
VTFVDPGLLYLAFGVLLCVVLLGIAVYYFSRKRKRTIEDAKYKMLLEDDD